MNTDRKKKRGGTGTVGSRVEVNPSLADASVREAFVVVARMDPPSESHVRLIGVMVEAARDAGATPHVFVVDGPERVLDAGFGVDLVRECVDDGVVVERCDGPSDAVDRLFREGFGRVTVFGSVDVDRDGVSVVGTGTPDDDPDAFSDVMREAAASGDRDVFESLLPETLRPVADDVLEAVVESTRLAAEVSEAVLNLQQRVRRAHIMRRYENKIKRARERAMLRLAREKQIRRRSLAAARKIVRKRVAGKRGLDYANLSPTDKIQIDKMTDGKVALIRRLAARLAPRVRQADARRLQARRAGAVSGTNGGLGKMPVVRTVREGCVEVDASDLPIVLEAIMRTAHDDPMLDRLLRDGLVDRRELADVRRALADPEAAARNPRLREKLLRMLGKLTDAVLSDRTLMQRVRRAVRTK